MSSVYHPPIDGLNEFINKYWETYLHCFTSEEQHMWQSGSLSLNGGTIIPTILHLKWLHMKQFMVTHLQYSFHTPLAVHQFRKLTWFFEADIRFFTFCRTIFTWSEPAWNTKPINIVLSALFKSVTWFFFLCSLTSNPPWKSKGIKCSFQISLVHI